MQGLIHQLHIRHDDRNIFKIETFGFVTGGVMNITVNNFAVLFTLKEKAEQEQERLRQSALNAPDTSTPTSKPVSSSLGEDQSSAGDIPTAKDTDTAKESEKEKVKATEKVVEKVAVKEKEQDSDTDTDTDTGKESTIEKSRVKGAEKEKEI